MTTLPRFRFSLLNIDGNDDGAVFSGATEDDARRAAIAAGVIPGSLLESGPYVGWDGYDNRADAVAHLVDRLELTAAADGNDGITALTDYAADAAHRTHDPEPVTDAIQLIALEVADKAAWSVAEWHRLPEAWDLYGLLSGSIADGRRCGCGDCWDDEIAAAFAVIAEHDGGDDYADARVSDICDALGFGAWN